jgi:predicted dehydrogenase
MVRQAFYELYQEAHTPWEWHKPIFDKAKELGIIAFAWYSKGAFNNGSHLLDLLGYWFGGIKSVESHKYIRALSSHDADIDFSVEFDFGEAVFCALDEANFSHYTIEIIAENGRLRYDDLGNTILWQNAADDPRYLGYKSINNAVVNIRTSLHNVQLSVMDGIYKDLNMSSSFISMGRGYLALIGCLSDLVHAKSISKIGV